MTGDSLEGDVPREPVLPPERDLPENGIDLPAIIAQIEKGLIDRALARTAQNRGAAARLLGFEANHVGGETKANVSRRGGGIAQKKEY